MAGEIHLVVVREKGQIPDWLAIGDLKGFLHHEMKPYNDTIEDVGQALDYAFSSDPGRGGFLLLAVRDSSLVGAVVFLKTGMGGYIPENLLLFVVVDPTLRGQGIGHKLVQRGLELCEGPVKLHVEHDNPARRLYERMGFTSKYLEMRHENS